MRFPDTIYALSSGAVPSGVAVVRMSGEAVRPVLEAVAGGVPAPRYAALRLLRDVNGAAIDQALVLFFPGPHSETGEDMAEFHLHGGKAVVAAMLSRLSEFARCRHADAGEFARRSYLNGKMDLVQAEALGDLVAAETEAQRRQALANAGGAQSRLYESWRSEVVDVLALVEAELDFADEADVPGSVSGQVWPRVNRLVREIESHIAGFRSAEIVREGFQVVILGPPNAGKSSLLNALATRDVAIVSDEPGTTRDLVEVALDIDGHKVVLTDTAGVRTAEGVEAIGVRRGLERARGADLVLSVLPVDSAEAFVDPPGGVECLNVWTKADLARRPPDGPAVSTVTGEGMEKLIAVLGQRAAAAGVASGRAVPTRLRHVELIQRLKADLLTAVEGAEAPELRAEHLRSAAHRIGQLTGRVDVEDVLDRIFAQFCVGK